MCQTINNEKVVFLIDELESIKNMLSMAVMALEASEDELVPTAIETAYVQLQGLVDEFCVVGSER